MRRKLLTLLLTLALVLGLLPLTAMAAEAPTSGTCGENLTWTFSDGILTIEGTGPMEDYEFDPNANVTYPWFIYIVEGQIQTVRIGDGVTRIGNGAFAYCSMTSLTIPDSVTTIGDAAFHGCSNLTSVTIPDSVTTIEGGAFYYCTSLTSVTIPDSVTFIAASAFADCTSLTSITIKSPDVRIGRAAFGLYDYYDDGEYIIAPVVGVTIYGYSGSTAQSYADSNGIAFVAFDTPDDPVEEPTPEELIIVPEASETMYVLESGGSVTIYCTGELSEFIRLLVDGQEVDASNYQLAEGSTVVTLVSAYLDTLSVGKHTVDLEFTGGTAQTTITILERSSQDSSQENNTSGNPAQGSNTPSRPNDSAPQTGDNRMLTMWMVLAVISFAGMAATVIYARKGRH